MRSDCCWQASPANRRSPIKKGSSSFKDPMMTAAAIDRLVRHSVIVELNVPSYRLEQARHNVPAADQETAAAPSSGEPTSGSGLRPSPPAGSPEAQVDVVSS
jgi:hypothetical protein